MRHTIAYTAMTCELISAAVTNVETILSKAEQKFFPPQKSHCLFDRCVGRLEKLCVCYKRRRLGPKAAGHIVNTQRTDS